MTNPPPSVRRAVQESLYQRFVAAWGDLSLFQLGNETFDPPDGPWVQLLVVARPSGNGTLGGPGRRRIDRSGAVFVQLRDAPGGGVGDMSDRADFALKIFESARIAEHDIRFSTGDIGAEGNIDDGRWWGCSVEIPFEYEDWN
jgi:hypothetical protein